MAGWVRPMTCARRSSVAAGIVGRQQLAALGEGRSLLKMQVRHHQQAALRPEQGTRQIGHEADTVQHQIHDNLQVFMFGSRRTIGNPAASSQPQRGDKDQSGSIPCGRPDRLQLRHGLVDQLVGGFVQQVVQGGAGDLLAADLQQHGHRQRRDAGEGAVVDPALDAGQHVRQPAHVGQPAGGVGAGGAEQHVVGFVLPQHVVDQVGTERHLPAGLLLSGMAALDQARRSPPRCGRSGAACWTRPSRLPGRRPACPDRTGCRCR